MTTSHTLRGAGLALGILATAMVSDAARTTASGQGIVLAPHRGIYDMVLDRSRGGSGVAEFNGRMVYELTGSACEGYTENMRFVMRMSNQEGNASVTDMRSSRWEDGDASNFRFSSSEFRDQELSSSTSGDAARGRPKEALKVTLTKPVKKNVSMAGDALFPVQHSKALLEAALAGRTMFTAPLYDGSEKGEKLYATTSVIGRKLEAGANRKLPAAKGGERLDGIASWPVSISYFDSAKEDSAPSYELAFRVYENGVSRRLFIDYGDFSIRGELIEIEFLEPSKCDREKKK